MEDMLQVILGEKQVRLAGEIKPFSHFWSFRHLNKLMQGAFFQMLD